MVGRQRASLGMGTAQRAAGRRRGDRIALARPSTAARARSGCSSGRSHRIPTRPRGASARFRTHPRLSPRPPRRARPLGGHRCRLPRRVHDRAGVQRSGNGHLLPPASRLEGLGRTSCSDVEGSDGRAPAVVLGALAAAPQTVESEGVKRLNHALLEGSQRGGRGDPL